VLLFSSYHFNQRLPWRKHFANLHRRHARALQSIDQRCISAGDGEQIYVGAAILFWWTERRTRRYTAVKDRRRCGGADWLGSGVTESNSRSEHNKEGYEQARDFHLLAPCRSGG
jgi:hypothetical protein